jgi:uncharacterized membrane protein required for colicin V production
MIIDVVVVLVLIVSLIVGYQRGVIQPLLAEIFFFGTLLVVFRFHDQYTTEMQKLLHLNAVLAVFVALIIAVVMGAIGGSIGGAFHRLESIRGIDGLLGVVVHGVVTLIVVYLALSALVTLDNAFQPALKTASLTLTQVNQLESEILSNPITSAMVSKSDLQALKTAASKSSGAHLDSDFLQPQLYGSRTAPFILGLGQHLPVIGHVKPSDLHNGTTASPARTATPTPSPKK